MIGEWTNEAVAKRILDETGGLIGDDIRARQEALICVWLETIRTQERRKSLSFDALRSVNVTRCRRWHPPESTPWNVADWSNATCGESGEMANVAKKIRRHETGARNEGDPPLEELKKMAAAEAADVVIYADLFCNHLGVDLGEAIKAKFNKTSEKYGFPERL